MQSLSLRLTSKHGKGNLLHKRWRVRWAGKPRMKFQPSQDLGSTAPSSSFRHAGIAPHHQPLHSPAARTWIIVGCAFEAIGTISDTGRYYVGTYLGYVCATQDVRSSTLLSKKPGGTSKLLIMRVERVCARNLGLRQILTNHQKKKKKTPTARSVKTIVGRLEHNHLYRAGAFTQELKAACVEV